MPSCLSIKWPVAIFNFIVAQNLAVVLLNVLILLVAAGCLLVAQSLRETHHTLAWLLVCELDPAAERESIESVADIDKLRPH